MTKLSAYPNERLTEPNNDDYVDVSIEISPGVYQSQKMKWSVVKAAFGGAISENIIAIGNSAGDGITESTGKAGGVVGFLDDFAIAHKDFFNDSEFLSYQDESGISYHSCATGETIRLSVGVSNKMTLAVGGVQASVTNGDVVTIGLSIGGGTGAKLEIRGDGTTTGNTFLAKDNNGDTGLRVEDSGLVFMRNGTGVNNISTDSDFSGATDDQLKTALAIKDFVESQSSGGWLGSETRIKIAPWVVVSYNDKDGVSIQDDGGVVNDAAAKITTMVTGVFIPTGYRATAFMINASANIAVELFESQIDDSTAVSKGSGNANTEVNITNVDSTTTNYLSIIIVEAGNDFYGGYITIEKI